MLQRMSGPPRGVPLSLCITSVLNGATQIGFVVTGFGFFFVVAFLANAELPSLGHRALATTRGYVTSVKSTRTSENRRTILANAYSFSVDGRSYSGVSYSTGQQLKPGDSVTVEYESADPASSNIQGMRRKIFSSAVLFMVIFPVAGIGLTVGAIVAGFFKVRDLRRNEIVTGRAVNRRWSPGRKTMYTVYEFTAGGATWQTSSRTRDTDEALVLYDPARPDRGSVLDTPVSGSELAGRPVAAILSFVIPIAVIVGDVAMARIFLS